MKAALIAVLVCLGGEAAAKAGRAAISLRLAPTVDACVDGHLDTVRQVVAVELNAELVGDDDATTALVDVSCASDEATIRVSDPASGATIERRVRMADEPVVGRPRLLGLAIAVTVEASRERQDAATIAAQSTRVPEPIAAPAPPPPPRPARATLTSARATPTTRPAPPTTRPERPPSGEVAPDVGLQPIDHGLPPPQGALSFGASFLVRAFSGGGLVNFGARLVGDWMVGDRFALSLDLTGERGGVSSSAGDVTFTMASLAPRFDERVWNGPVDLRIGAGFRIGLADVNGSSQTPGVEAHHFAAVWGGPMAAIEARVCLARPYGVAVGMEVGVATMSIAAQFNGADLGRVEGGWGTIWLSASYTP